jgi:branched-chain amino acid transport system substrate-binding protein
MKMKKLTVFLAVTFFLSIFAVDAFPQESLKLAIPLPLTRTYANFGEIEKRSYEIAMEEINAAGGIKGKKVLLEFKDSQGKPDVAKAIVENLIEKDKQPILFGEYSSSCSKVVAALAEAKKVPYLVVTGAADDITRQNYKYVFRMSPTNAYYPGGLIDFLQQVVKPKTMAILYESSDFGASGAADMARQAEQAGIKVVLKEQYTRETADYVTYDFQFLPDLKPMLQRVKEAKPDVIYMVSYLRDAVLLMHEIKDLGIEAKLHAGGAAGFSLPEFIQGAQKAAEDVVTVTLWDPRLGYPGAREFAEKYKNRFGEYPSYHGAEAYAALYVIKEALEKASTWTPEDIRAALKSTDTMTAFGPIKFEDKEGYTNQNFMKTLVEQVINGRFEIIWPEKLASRKYVFPIPRWSERK